MPASRIKLHLSAPLILASRSPRRLELLDQIGIIPNDVRPSQIAETRLANESPRAMAMRLAELKAREVWNKGEFVLGADTVVAVGSRDLGKANDAVEAKKFLQLLSGRAHRVIGGICVIAPDGRSIVRASVTRVTFKRLSFEEIENYIASNEWQDKAGAYAIQGLAGAFVKKISGSYPNVVGLDIYDASSMLHGLNN
ncbi:MAG: Maf family protein [Rhodospirillaceae bacterium]|nr:Maf family protein [Rhodospirillaceae bacterium]